MEKRNKNLTQSDIIKNKYNRTASFYDFMDNFFHLGQLV